MVSVITLEENWLLKYKKFVLCSTNTSDGRCFQCPTRVVYVSNSKFTLSNWRSLIHQITKIPQASNSSNGENHSDLASKKSPMSSRITVPISTWLRIARKDALMLHFNQLGRGLVHWSRIPSTGEREGCCRMAWTLHQPCNKCLLRITT
jgi:hypothetical protein